MTMFMMGMVLTTVMMMIFGVPKETRGQPPVTQYPQARQNTYSKN